MSKIVDHIEVEPTLDPLEEAVLAAEDRMEVTAYIMATPPNPTKASARVGWHRRPRSGPVNDSGFPLPETAE